MTSFRAVVMATVEIALVGALLAACGDDGDSEGSDDPTPSVDAAQVELAGHTFVASEVTGRELVEGSHLRLGFEDDAMSVSAGCNTLFGPYLDDDGVLRWEKQPAATMMACEPELSDQDAWLTTLFTDGMTIEDSDDADLVLTSGDVRMELSRSDLGGSTAPTQASTLDFAARLNGPLTANPPEVLMFTLTNVGRRRDTYRLTITPSDAGAVAPRHLAIGSGRSKKVQVEVTSAPLLVKVESLGAGGFVDAFAVK
jgi:heat shock protein HslJ